MTFIAIVLGCIQAFWWSFFGWIISEDQKSIKKLTDSQYAIIWILGIVFSTAFYLVIRNI